MVYTVETQDFINNSEHQTYTIHTLILRNTKELNFSLCFYLDCNTLIHLTPL